MCAANFALLLPYLHIGCKANENYRNRRVVQCFRGRMVESEKAVFEAVCGGARKDLA